MQSRLRNARQSCACQSRLSPALSCSPLHASALQAAQFKAMRCFFAAHGLLVTGKLPEAHALFGRAAQRASEASSLHEVGLAQQQFQQMKAVAASAALL